MKVFKSEEYIASGQTIGIFSMDQSAAEASHRHDFIEVVYVLSGSATQWVDETPYEVVRGDVIFINYGAEHAFAPHGEFRYVNICFMPEVLSSAIMPNNALALLSLTAFDEIRKDKNGGKLSFYSEERQEVEFLLSAMLREYRQDLPFSDRVIEHYLSALFAKMLRKIAMNDSFVPDLWEELRAYIDENPGGELTLSALAKKCFYHPAYFSRVFKQRFGISPSEYVRQKRMEYAMRLLQETELPVDEIIPRAGYNDRSAFYHAFSRAASMTPAEFRAKVKETHNPV